MNLSNRASRSAGGLTRVEAPAYRCFRYVSQPFSPFEVLVGSNASGKSCERLAKADFPIAAVSRHAAPLRHHVDRFTFQLLPALRRLPCPGRP